MFLRNNEDFVATPAADASVENLGPLVSVLARAVTRLLPSPMFTSQMRTWIEAEAAFTAQSAGLHAKAEADVAAVSAAVARERATNAAQAALITSAANGLATQQGQIVALQVAVAALQARVK